jgi:hypothetical protein
VAADPAVTAEIRFKTAQAFSRLPYKLRTAAFLVIVEEQSHKEVAEALGISTVAVKLRVFRALRLLRKDSGKAGNHTMNHEEGMKQLLKQAVRPVKANAEPESDLWPAVLRRMDEHTATETAGGPRWAWFDGALLVGLVVLGVSFPATIPLLLYYL